LRARAAIPDHDDFTARLDAAGLRDFTLDKAETWLRGCACPTEDEPNAHCEVHLVAKHCDLFGETVETEFERIQNWYRTPRFTADPGLKELITEFRTPGNERAARGRDSSRLDSNPNRTYFPLGVVCK
jgi:hypothetical protein